MPPLANIRALTGRAVLELAKFDKAMQDGKIDVDWTIDKLTYVDGTLGLTVRIVTEVGVVMENRIAVDVLGLFEQAKPALVGIVKDAIEASK